MTRCGLGGDDGRHAGDPQGQHGDAEAPEELARSFTSGGEQGAHAKPFHGFLGSFPAEHALDNGGGQCVGVPSDLLAGDRSLPAKPVGRLVHRLLDFAPRRGNQFGATLERGPALVIHLVVDLGSRGPCARVEFIRGDLCLGARRFGKLAGRTNRAFACAHDACERPEEQTVEQDRQGQHQRDDPGDREIGNQNKDLYHLATNLDKLA